jgi:BirA family biotin operon repressor/biotin-[acetyl-CoA-carboxylase] ligase
MVVNPRKETLVMSTAHHLKKSTKTYVLELLEESRGESISGAILAQHLSVSRNAVWKAVKELEKEGYKIEAVTNKGYRLCEDNDILSTVGIASHLIDERHADKIHIFDSLESTNTKAKELAISGASHATVVVAEAQTGGKGRYGRSFFSPAGCGVYMSIILRPSKEPPLFETPSLVTAFAAVAVCEAIESAAGKKPQIKWVNDLFLGDKKICGISTEAVIDLESGVTPWIVVGIGINTTISDELPEELESIIGSVYTDEELSDKGAARNRLVAAITDRMTGFDASLGGNVADVLESYRSRLMVLGKPVMVTGVGEPFEAIVRELDDKGHLLVERDNGELVRLAAGEVSIKMNAGE